MKLSIVLFIYLAIFIFVPVLIGVYVYRDAKNRGMTAPLWTLISILAPALVGFIIYLLVRGSYSDMKCQKCAAAVTEQFVSCPHCGARLKATCPNCAFPVEAGWKVCPCCAAPLPEGDGGISAPVRKKDRTLGKILLAVILLPLLVLAVLVASWSTSPLGATSVAYMSVEDYRQGVDNPQIEAWLDRCEQASGEAYVLRYQSSQGDQAKVRYLIYMPGFADQSEVSIDHSSGLLWNFLKLKFTDSGKSTGNTLLLVTYFAKDVPTLQLYYDGGRVDYELTETDYPFGLIDYTD